MSKKKRTSQKICLTASKKISSAKIEAVCEQMQELIDDGHKVLIFTQFLGVIELLQNYTKENHIKTYVITGETEKRQELVKEFQQDDTPSVFLLSLKAANTGINLTTASYVFIIDPWWNPAVEAQAIDRTHRIGQKNSVVAYRFITKGTIEEKIRKMQEKKSALVDDLYAERDFSEAVSLEEMRALFEE